MHCSTHIVAEAAAVDHACCPQRVPEVRSQVQGCQLPSAAAEHAVMQALDGCALLHIHSSSSSGSTSAQLESMRCRLSSKHTNSIQQ
jgi:hypothetical protein